MIKQFIADESGATAIEYGLIAAILCIGIVAGLTNLRTALNTAYTNIGNSFSTR